jgi:hypothetical protein
MAPCKRLTVRKSERDQEGITGDQEGRRLVFSWFSLFFCVGRSDCDSILKFNGLFPRALFCCSVGFAVANCTAAATLSRERKEAS